MILFALLLPLLLVIYWTDIGIYSYRCHRHRKKIQAKRTLAIQYQPPDGFKPGEIGELAHFAGYKSVCATLVDLAIRGYILITETKPRSTLQSAQYELTLLKSVDELEQYEIQMLNLMFDSKTLAQGASSDLKSRISCKPNQRPQRYARMHNIRNSLTNYMEAKGHLKSGGGSRSNENKNKGASLGPIKMIIGFTIALIVYAVFIWLIDNGLLPVGQGLLLLTILLILPSILLGTKAVASSQAGYEMSAEVEGFKLYLSMTTAERAKFENAPEATPALFNKFLPYAIALGVELNWSAQFADIDLSKDKITWFTGSSAGFDTMAFVEGIRAVIDPFTYTPIF